MVVRIEAYCGDGEGNTTFSLEDTKIIEFGAVARWFCKRKHVASALKMKSREILVGLDWPQYPCEPGKYCFIVNSKSIQIGCMRFTGKDAKALREWAESAGGK